MEAEVGDLKVEEVELLLGLYKDVVAKYSRLRDAVKGLSLDKALTLVAMDERSQLTFKNGIGKRNQQTKLKQAD